MWKKRAVCAILAGLLLTTMAGSGGETEKESDKPDTTPGSESVSEETEKPDVLAGLSYDDATFHIMSSDTSISSHNLLAGSGEETGEAVNDAVFRRNVETEDALHVRFTYTTTNRDWGSVSTEVIRLVQAGESAYDMIIDDQRGLANASIQRVFKDAAAIPTMDLSEDCWWSEYMRNLSIDYKSVYLLVGDYFLDVLNHSHALLYNRDIYREVIGDPDELYQLVNDGKWTYDAWIPLIEQGYSDLNGDGKPDKDDRFGLIVDGISGSTFPYTYGSDIPYVTRDENGYTTLTMYGDRLIKLYEKIRAVFYNDGTSTKYPDNTAPLHNKFIGGGALFISGTGLGDFGVFSTMEQEAGIIPYPKLDEEQERYRTVVHDTAEVGVIPETVSNPEMSGAVAQMLCRKTKEIVLPAYYEQSLKIRYARDMYTSSMIDLIHDGITDMFCMVYGGSFANDIFTWTILAPLQKNADSITSEYEKRRPAAEKGLADMAATYEAAGN